MSIGRVKQTNETKLKVFLLRFAVQKFLRLMMDQIHVRICNAQYRANDREPVCRNGPWL